MTEQKLKEYLENKLTADQLSLDLKNSQKRKVYDVTTVYIDSFKDGEFEIKKEHLIKLCDDAISEQLSTSDLNTIGFALLASDFFYWDNETTDGEIIANVIFEWDNPEIGYELTIDNLKLWREYLLTTNYNFDKNELKDKFRNDGKRRNKNRTK